MTASSRSIPAATTISSMRAASASPCRPAAKAKQDVQRKHMQAFIDRFRYKASKARQAQSRLKALAKMEPIAAVIEERGIEFQFPEPEELAPPLIVMDNVAVGYEPGKPILNKVDPAPRSRRAHRAARRQRQRQVDHGEAAGRPPAADERRVAPLAQAEGRLFRPAPDRRAGSRRDAPALDGARRAQAASREVPRAPGAVRPRRACAPTPRSAASAAARRRACCWR